MCVVFFWDLFGRGRCGLFAVYRIWLSDFWMNRNGNVCSCRIKKVEICTFLIDWIFILFGRSILRILRVHCLKYAHRCGNTLMNLNSST